MSLVGLIIDHSCTLPSSSKRTHTDTDTHVTTKKYMPHYFLTFYTPPGYCP